jgi:hypothetical protein
MALFTIAAQVTTTKAGVPQTTSYTAVYILEGGAWMFWFSKPNEGTRGQAMR